MAEIKGGLHAKLSASGAHRWMACPGSIRASEGIKNVSSVYAAEGTVAHEIGAEVLTRNCSIKDFLGNKYTVEGFDFTVDEAMLDAVQLYVDEVDSRSDVWDRVYVEKSLTPALQKLDPEFGGTADCIIHKEEKGILEVIDYKHGAGVPVSVEGNKQLMYYALGALLTFKGYGRPIKTVVVTVVQPRCSIEDASVRSWEFAAFDLLDFEADLLAAAGETRTASPRMESGGHCQFCRARPSCPELQAKEQQLMAVEFDDLTEVDTQEVITILSPEQISKALGIFPAIEERMRAIREAAYAVLAGGGSVPGYKLVPKRATRKWVDEKAVGARLADNPACWSTPTIKSPAQVEKALGKKTFASAMEGLVISESSGYNVVSDSDKRPAARLTTSDDFDVLT